MSRVSSGGRKSGPPAHRNATAWVPDPRSGLAQRIAAIPVDGFCRRCSEIVAFKKKVGQYKPLKDKKKCITCSQKAISQAYHVICPACAHPPSGPLCAKCREPLTSSNAPPPVPYDRHAPVKIDPNEREEKAELEGVLKMVSERRRRTVLRRLERGDLRMAEAKELAESFKKKGGDDFGLDFGDDFSDDEDSDEEGNKAKSTKVVRAPAKGKATKPADSEEDEDEEEDEEDSEQDSE